MMTDWVDGYVTITVQLRAEITKPCIDARRSLIPWLQYRTSTNLLHVPKS